MPDDRAALDIGQLVRVRTVESAYRERVEPIVQAALAQSLAAVSQLPECADLTLSEAIRLFEVTVAAEITAARTCLGQIGGD